MRRRLLTATISAVLMAVVMLGIPFAISAAQAVRDNAVEDLVFRTETTAHLLTARIERGESVRREVLNNYVSGPSLLDASIILTVPPGLDEDLPEGMVLPAGPTYERTFSHTVVTESGITVTMEIDWWDVFWQAVESVALVIGTGLAAIVAGFALATWQANRLSRPLVYLAATAEHMGSGQTRPKVEASGVEEIDLVAEELSRSSERMAARLDAERQFTADASHQLRTPLTALTMRLEEISATATTPEIRTEVDAALDQVERLVGVVDDLLGRTRKALGGSTETVVLQKVLRQQREEWEDTFIAHGRTLVIEDTDATVFASPGGLAQVLATLIENSLIHGNGTTTVSTHDSPSSTAIVIKVADEGEGVAEEFAPKIFQRNVTSGKGSGLGLALARDLVTADGGRLELTQRAPAVFSVFLQGVPRMVDLEKVIPHAARRRPRRRWGRTNP